MATHTGDDAVRHFGLHASMERQSQDSPGDIVGVLQGPGRTAMA
jgi:hypothetical protein